jgi:iron complex outermembrane receptor protein
VTYRAGANYHPAENQLYYVMVSKGFKSGGFQDTPSSAEDAAHGFEPEYATQYEVGQKSTFLNGALTWNNTLYVMKYSDLQTKRTDGLNIITDNAGKATIKGYETYLSWRPFAHARLVASYGYTDARFDEFMPEPGVDYAGNRISRTPKHKVVLSPSYDLPLGDRGELRFAVDYRYESHIYDDNSNTGPEQRPATNFFDGRIVYSAPSDKLALSLWGKNLTNELTRTYQGRVPRGQFRRLQSSPDLRRHLERQDVGALERSAPRAGRSLFPHDFIRGRHWRAKVA